MSVYPLIIQCIYARFSQECILYIGRIAWNACAHCNYLPLDIFFWVVRFLKCMFGPVGLQKCLRSKFTCRLWATLFWTPDSHLLFVERLLVNHRSLPALEEAGGSSEGKGESDLVWNSNRTDLKCYWTWYLKGYVYICAWQKDITFFIRYCMDSTCFYKCLLVLIIISSPVFWKTFCAYSIKKLA